MSDYWFNQRYEDLILDEHQKGHPQSNSENCCWCEKD